MSASRSRRWCHNVSGSSSLNCGRWPRRLGTAAWCYEPTSARLLDHLVGDGHERCGNIKAEFLCRLCVDDQFEFDRRLNREVGRVLAAKDSIDIRCRATKRALPLTCTGLPPAGSHQLAWRTYSITSSACAKSAGGTVRPRDLAVLRLITNSNCVGRTTASSAGFAPFSTRPV
jgi:hypothetical protein